MAILIAGCRGLDPAGVYKGDQVLYNADKTITESYKVFQAFVTWDYQNRAALATIPAIHASAEAVRTNARNWLNSAVALREAYKSDPSQVNSDKLVSAISVLQTALAQATTYMNANKPK